MAKKEKEEEAVAVEGEEGAPKKSKKKLIIIIVVVLLLIGGGAAGAYFGGFIGPKKGAKETAAHKEAGHEKEAEKEGEKEEAHAEPEKAAEGEHGEKKEGEEGESAPIPGAPVYYRLKPFLVNLNTGSNQVSFIKLTVSLELANIKDKPMIEALEPRIANDFNTYMRELRASDLAGSAGIERLREELMARVNKAVAPAKVKDILFEDILIQ